MDTARHARILPLGRYMLCCVSMSGSPGLSLGWRRGQRHRMSIAQSRLTSSLPSMPNEPRAKQTR